MQTSFKTVKPPLLGSLEWEREKQEITAFCAEHGIKTVAPCFFHDLVQIANGSDLLDRASFLQKTEQDATFLAQAMVDVEEGQEKAECFRKYQQNAYSFLESIKKSGKLDILPGTDFEKAASFILALSKASDMGGSKEDGMYLPVFFEKDGANLAKQYIDCFEEICSIGDLTPEERDFMGGNGGGLPTEMNLLDKMTNEIEGQMVVLSRKLDKLPCMATKREKSREQSPVPTRVIATRGIKDFSELPKITRQSWGLPDSIFEQRLVQKTLYVKQYVKVLEKKQLIYILLDVSGSMNDGNKIARAGAILLNRIKAVIRNEAEIFVRGFDSQPQQMLEAHDPEQARSLLRQIAGGKAFSSGGGTCFRAALECAVSDIEKDRSRFHRCDICIITDGEDNANGVNLQGIGLNAFSVKDICTSLRDISNVFVLVNEQMKIKVCSKPEQIEQGK